MINVEIRRRLLAMDDLPTLPQVMARILETVEDEGASAQDLTDILESDHAVSARVLKLANSVYTGLPVKVESLRRAVVFIGFEAVRDLALATSVLDAFRGRRLYGLDPQDFWMHSFGAARAADLLVRRCAPNASTSACFTGALLHDIGKFLLSLGLKEEYCEICDEARSKRRPLREVELERLGTTNSDVGGWIGAVWRFPPLIIDLIENHNRMSPRGVATSQELCIVSLADLLSSRAGFGDACGDPVDRLDLENPMRLSGEYLEEIVRELERVRDETALAYRLMVGA